MSVDNPNKPPSLLLLLIYISLILLGILIILMIISYLAPKTPQNSPQTLSDAFYEAPRIPYIPKPHTYGSLIDCLAFYESSNNPYAIGLANEKGILQFLPSTFQYFCVEKYGLTDNIWNVEIQKECAIEMIAEGKINSWTTASKCI